MVGLGFLEAHQCQTLVNSPELSLLRGRTANSHYFGETGGRGTQEVISEFVDAYNQHSAINHQFEPKYSQFFSEKSSR